MIPFKKIDITDKTWIEPSFTSVKKAFGMIHPSGSIDLAMGPESLGYLGLAYD